MQLITKSMEHGGFPAPTNNGHVLVEPEVQ
jgi:hypothetical protein